MFNVWWQIFQTYLKGLICESYSHENSNLIARPVMITEKIDIEIETQAGVFPSRNGVTLVIKLTLSNQQMLPVCTVHKGKVGNGQIFLKTPRRLKLQERASVPITVVRQGISKHLGVNFKNMVTTWECCTYFNRLPEYWSVSLRCLELEFQLEHYLSRVEITRNQAH